MIKKLYEWDTKIIHWFYWVLRTLKLRPKARLIQEKSKDGKTLIIKIDKIDPGEVVDVQLLMAELIVNKQNGT